MRRVIKEISQSVWGVKLNSAIVTVIPSLQNHTAGEITFRKWNYGLEQDMSDKER